MDERAFKRLYSLEMAHIAFKEGKLHGQYLRRAANLQCECGNASPFCAQSEHALWREQMWMAAEREDGKVHD